MIILLPPFIMLHSSSRCNLCCLLLCFTQPLASMLMLFHFPYKNKKQNRQKCCIHSILVQSLSYKKKIVNSQVSLLFDDCFATSFHNVTFIIKALFIFAFIVLQSTTCLHAVVVPFSLLSSRNLVPTSRILVDFCSFRLI